MFIPLYVLFCFYSEVLCYNKKYGLRSQDELGSNSGHTPNPKLLRALEKVTKSP